MAIKLADTLAPMADFPAVEAKDVAFDDNKTLQEKLNNGELGGSGGEENAIDSISVNGTPITPDENKNVDIEVPSIEGLAKDTDLSTVAKSGSYNDLENKPTIPTVTNDLTNELKSSYDSAVTAKHTHSNKDMLDKLSVNSSGVVLYNGNPIIIPTSRPTILSNGSIWVE